MQTDARPDNKDGLILRGVDEAKHRRHLPVCPREENNLSALRRDCCLSGLANTEGSQGKEEGGSGSVSVHICATGEREARKGEAKLEQGQRSKGVALVLALIMLSVLVILIGQFQYSANVDARIAENYAVDRENYYAARGALNVANALLIKDADKNDGVDTLADDWANSSLLDSVSTGSVSTSIVVEDQERFLNVNRLSDKVEPIAANREWTKDSLGRLITILEMDPKLAECISDWIDARDAPLTTIEEMRQIPEVTNNILYGYVDEQEEKHEGLASYITLWGKGKVNINTAGPTILLAILPQITPDIVSAIIQYRENPENPPFKSADEFLNKVKELGGTLQYSDQLELRKHITWSSTFFEVSIGVRKGYLKMQVEAVVERVRWKGKNIINQWFWKER